MTSNNYTPGITSFNNIIKAYEDVADSASFKGAINCPMKEELLEQIALMKEIREDLFNPKNKLS